MPFHAPSSLTFWLSVILVVLAVILRFGHISPAGTYAGWLGVAGYVILVIGCTVKTA